MVGKHLGEVAINMEGVDPQVVGTTLEDTSLEGALDIVDLGIDSFNN